MNKSGTLHIGFLQYGFPLVIFLLHTQSLFDGPQVELMNHLGYQLIFSPFLVLQSFLRSLVFGKKFSPTLREWAYAGITINLVNNCLTRSNR